MRNAIFAALLLAALIGCSGPDQSPSAKESRASPTVDAGNVVGRSGGASGGLPSYDLDQEPANKTIADVRVRDARRVVRTGSATVRVENAESAEAAVVALLGSGPGYVEKSSATGFDKGSPRVVMTVRVPSQEFESFIASVCKLGTMLAKNIDTKDVTAELADYGAIIKTHLAREEALRATLREARSTSEIMEAQRQITELRLQIDRVEAQSSALSKLADLSNVEVTLVQEANTATSPTDPDWFGQTLASATASFMTVFRGVAALATWVVVFSPIWLAVCALLFVVFRRVARKPQMTL